MTFMPNDDRPDVGTELGRMTRVLTGVFSVVLVSPLRVARAVSRSIRWVGDSWQNASRNRRIIFVAVPAVAFLALLGIVAPAAVVAIGAFVFWSAVSVAIGLAFGGAFWIIVRLCQMLGGPLVRLIIRCLDRAVRVVRRGDYAFRVAFLRARSRAARPVVSAMPSVFDDEERAIPTVPFTVTVHQTEYLPRDGREVHAIIEVTAEPIEDESTPPDIVEVLLLDGSGSMRHPWSKLRAVRQAAEAAIDTLRDGTWFAVVRG